MGGWLEVPTHAMTDRQALASALAVSVALHSGAFLSGMAGWRLSPDPERGRLIVDLIDPIVVPAAAIAGPVATAPPVVTTPRRGVVSARTGAPRMAWPERPLAVGREGSELPVAAPALPAASPPAPLPPDLPAQLPPASPGGGTLAGPPALHGPVDAARPVSRPGAPAAAPGVAFPAAPASEPAMLRMPSPAPGAASEPRRSAEASLDAPPAATRPGAGTGTPREGAAERDERDGRAAALPATAGGEGRADGAGSSVPPLREGGGGPAGSPVVDPGQPGGASDERPSRVAGRGPGVPPEYDGYVAALRRRIQERLDYPWIAVRQRLQGVVELELEVEADGRLGRVSVVGGDAPRALREAAVRAVREAAPFPFPGDLAARPLAVRLPVVFELR